MREVGEYVEPLPRGKRYSGGKTYKGAIEVEGCHAQVFNKRIHHIPPGSVYIGRPSKWGNPFVIGKDGTREEVIEKFKEYLLANEELLADLHELQAKNLVCFCAPHPCHGKVLLELANAREIGMANRDSIDTVIEIPGRVFVNVHRPVEFIDMRVVLGEVPREDS